MKISYRAHLILLAFLPILLVQCKKVLDKTNLSLITSDKVLNDPALAAAHLNLIYRSSTPGWAAGASASSDEGPGSGTLMYGRVQDNSQTFYQTAYQNIRQINIFLEAVKAGTIEKPVADPMIGQALFFRSIVYWQLATTYGGVPLVLNTLKPNDEFDLPRASTSQTVTQILKDLDDAIALLPDRYSDNNADFGRITKGAAMAVKGRILLHYASEQFDPTQSKNRWQAAYDALVAAKTNLDANGKGLNASFSNLWFDPPSANKEIIWVRLYNADASHSRDASVRPYQPGFGGGRVDNATKSLADAFPMKDGKKISDPTSAYAYDPVAFWKNRDPRFAATLVWNGANWPIKDPSPFKTSAIYWSFQNNTSVPEADNNGVTRTGFQTRKGVRVDYDHNQARLSTVPWIEMRYAELLLNLAEAANEIGKGTEALTHLTAIRQRAGIENTNGRYGLDAGLEADKTAMRDAILNERRIELAFENKRPVDMRRRRLYGTLNGTERMGYFITKTPAFDALVTSDNSFLSDRMALENLVLAGTVDLNNPAVYQTYFTTQVYSVEEGSNIPGQIGVKINYLDKYYFFDIPQAFINQNPKLKQTNGWPGGSFDPLQ
jgi:hypothetical protein